MSLGPCIHAGWFGILIASQLLAGSHINRGGVIGVIRGFAGIVGAFLCWAFVSAYCSANEMPGYVDSRAFSLSMGIGLIGFMMFLLSCLTIVTKGKSVERGAL